MSLLSRRSLATAAAVGVGIATITGLGAAPATADAWSPHVLSSAYVGPLQFAVDGRSIYVADSAQSKLFKVGRTAPIAVGPAPSANPEQSGDLAGVAAADGTIAYTTTTADHQDTRLTILRHGHKQVVSLSAFERRYNPDKRNTYGLVNAGAVSAKCKAELTAGGMKTSLYRGAYDSHPYAVASLGNGSWAVADAGGNDILRVDRWGHVSLLALLPAQPLQITADMAKQNGAPDCTGITYRFEPVPTDVEVGPHWDLYATTLSAAPGASGSVWRIRHGDLDRIATGFVGATNLAVTPGGRIYVAQLFAGTIAVVRGHGPQVVASLPGVAAVEWSCGHLYASTAPAVTGGSGPGTIVRFG
ncbi:MAG: ScyD/ScyE family protein [Amnibacterium sp.]